MAVNPPSARQNLLKGLFHHRIRVPLMVTFSYRRKGVVIGALAVLALAIIGGSYAPYKGNT